ncbi:MAG: NeuD/PglB/VioB family sugar acetyltransferase [Candidatus Krumholzibacteria bacterium]|jgi:UDP-perosamine 4-acetyltransferase|nr:NeuD/PglB/VioB family sugar acetyltransferase [Candidatus Krumholzibacteria bacterium]
MNRIVVIGGGGHAKVLVSILQKTGYDIAGYTDRVDRGELLGVSYLGGDDRLAEIIAREPRCRAALGIGKLDTGAGRLELLTRLSGLGFSLPPIVSCHGVVNRDVALGDGTVVFDGAVVNSGARIGAAGILNTHCTVEHDCELGDDVHVAPGVVLCGGVRVGDHCLIGTGACVIQGVRIGPRVLVGAGAVVVADLARPGVYVGNPARRLR